MVFCFLKFRTDGDGDGDGDGMRSENVEDVHSCTELMGEEWLWLSHDAISKTHDSYLQEKARATRNVDDQFLERDR
jgi:hypothetical protein